MLKDPQQLFNYGEDNARNRSIKFSEVTEIEKSSQEIMTLIKQATENSLQGLHATVADKTIETPADLKQALVQAGLLERFNSQTYTMKKEYIVWIEDAKKDETRLRRIKKAIEQI